jgi:hypothetical protein
MPFMTVTEYGRHRGVSHTRISQLKQRLRENGCLTDSGRINQEKADAYLDGSLDSGKRRRNAPKKPLTVPDGTTETQARTRSLLIKAQRDELRLEKERGELLDASEVRNQAFTRARATRDAMQAIPARISAEFAAMTDAFEIQTKLTREIDKALQGEVDRWSCTGCAIFKEESKRDEK